VLNAKMPGKLAFALVFYAVLLACFSVTMVFNNKKAST
jgi:hypothetical protein